MTAYRLNAEEGGGPDLEPTLYPFMRLCAMFVPLMGFWTLLVYVRLRYLTLREQETSREDAESSLKSFRRVIWGVDAGVAGSRKGARSAPNRYGPKPT